MSVTVDPFSKLNLKTDGSTPTDSAAASVAAAATTAKESSARFLKLLVAQLQNQDPLSPMDNAQVTSQIAQINTVSGIEKLNTTVESLSGQYVQMQALQGASLVGHEVALPGNRLDVSNGVASGGFELSGKASAVKVEVLNGAGVVLQTVNLGQQDAGLNDFSFAAKGYDNASGLKFRVTASNGTANVPATALTHDKVTAVSTKGDALMLELQNGDSVAYSSIKSVS